MADFKESRESFNLVWDPIQKKWIPRNVGLVAWDSFTNTYKPVMGVLSNKSAGGAYTRLALTLVDAGGNPIGWSGGSKPVITRNLAFWGTDFQNGRSQGGSGDNPVIPISTLTNASGHTLMHTYGSDYWILIRNIIVSNTSNVGAWLRVLQYPTAGNPEIARFWCPPSDTRIYQGEPLIKGAVSSSPRFILAAESNVDSLWVTTLHYQDLFWG